MKADRMMWKQLCDFSAQQLRSDFAKFVVAYACEKRRRIQTERYLITATFAFCLLTTLGGHWYWANANETKNWEAWNQIIKETKPLEKYL